MGNNSGIPNSHCRKSSLYINVELAFCFGPKEEGEYLVVQVQAEEAKEGLRVPEQSQTHSRCSVSFALKEMCFLQPLPKMKERCPLPSPLTQVSWAEGEASLLRAPGAHH